MGAKTHVTNDKISASKLILEIFQTLEGLLNPKRLILKASTTIVRLRNFSNTWDKPPLLPVLKISNALVHALFRGEIYWIHCRPNYFSGKQTEGRKKDFDIICLEEVKMNIQPKNNPY